MYLCSPNCTHFSISGQQSLLDDLYEGFVHQMDCKYISFQRRHDTMGNQRQLLDLVDDLWLAKLCLDHKESHSPHVLRYSEVWPDFSFGGS